MLAVITKASAQLPVSAQLTAITGASVLQPAACVALRVRYQAIHPAKVVSPPVANRLRRRDHGRAARPPAATTPARTAYMTMSRMGKSMSNLSESVRG